MDFLQLANLTNLFQIPPNSALKRLEPILQRHYTIKKMALFLKNAILLITKFYFFFKRRYIQSFKDLIHGLKPPLKAGNRSSRRDSRCVKAILL